MSKVSTMVSGSKREENRFREQCERKADRI